MKVWLTCFILLFGAAEVLHWVKQFSLPLPIFVLAGAVLAIASNYDKLTHLPFHLDYEKPEVPQAELPVAQRPEVADAPLQKTVRDRPNETPISFTIRKPHQPES